VVGGGSVIQKLFLGVLLLVGMSDASAGLPMVNGLYVNTFGDQSNPALIFVHGGPGDDSSMFEATDAPILAKKGYFVIVYDERGQGRSSYDAGQSGYNYKTYLDDLSTLIQSLKIKNPILLAHSHGGSVAAHFNMNYPGVAQKIVLIDAPVDMWQAFLDMKTNCTALYQVASDQAGIAKLTQAMDVITAESTNVMTDNLKELSDNVEKLFGIGATCGRPSGLYFAPGAAPNAMALYTDWGKLYQAEVLPKLKAAPADADPVTGFIQNERYVRVDYSDEVRKNVTRYYGIYGDQDGLFTTNALEKIKGILGTGHMKFQLIHGASHNVFVDQLDAFNDALTNILRN
jgi:proline iminopeptidase